MAGATPVFVDVEPDMPGPRSQRSWSGPSRRARGPSCRCTSTGIRLRSTPWSGLARDHGVALIEDTAQAIGASWQGRPVGAWGDVACLSFYPTKPLGACGDAGMIVTDRDDVAARARRLRHHGDGGRYAMSSSAGAAGSTSSRPPCCG